MSWFIRGSTPHSANNRLNGMRVGETPHMVRGRETGAQAQPEDDFVGTRKRFPRRWTVASCLGPQILTKKGEHT